MLLKKETYKENEMLQEYNDGWNVCGSGSVGHRNAQGLNIYIYS
jgi:hypothetical protein